MSKEFIIGTIIGLIGIIPTIIWFIKWIRNRTPNLQELMAQLQGLMTQLVKDDITQDKQQVIREISAGIYKIIGQPLSEEYIKEFDLEKFEKKGKEAVFEDMCRANNIKPSTKLCKALLNYDSPSIKKKLQHAEQSTLLTKTVENQNEMLENKRQIVYMSALLKERYPGTCKQLIDILNKHAVPHKFLKETKDIWCRDYMPVQTAKGKLVAFRYEPSYLKGYENTRSDVREVCKANNIQLKEEEVSNINLDGGNVLICSDRAILSDRVFDENPEYTDKKTLIAEIEKLLEAKVILIPAHPKKYDLTGHADGMVRFVDRNTILGNDRKDEYKDWRNKINKVLQEHELNYLDVPFLWDFKDENHPDHAIGIYVNYLEVNDLIILPIFEVLGNKDNEAVKRFREIFPDRKIETINYNEIGLEGGLLNCTTWTIFEKTDE